MPFVHKGDDDNGSTDGGTAPVGGSTGGVDNQGGVSMSNAFRSFLRVTLRLIASGALTAFVDQLAGGLSPSLAALVLGVWASVLTYAQVAVEDRTGNKILVTPSTSTAVVNHITQTDGR